MITTDPSVVTLIWFQLFIESNLSSKPGSRAYITTTDAAHPVMFSVFRCSGSEFSIADCSGDLVSGQVITCGQNAQGVQCQGNHTMLPQYNNHNCTHTYKQCMLYSFVIAVLQYKIALVCYI